MPEALQLPGMADAEPDLSTFENKTGLAEDMKFLASMPELCDVTFLVGDTREPVCAVKVGVSNVYKQPIYINNETIYYLGCFGFTFTRVCQNAVFRSIAAKKT